MNEISGIRLQHQSSLQLLVIIIRQQTSYLLGEYAGFNKYHITSIRQWRILSRRYFFRNAKLYLVAEDAFKFFLISLTPPTPLANQGELDGVFGKAWWAIQDLKGNMDMS